MRRIHVEPEQLESCAARMDSENQEYLSYCKALMNAVNAMSAAWQGKDNLAFTDQITSYQSDFKQLSILCSQYSDFLKHSARAYRETQDELAHQATYLGK